MGAWALLMYMLVYAFMNIGAFGYVVLLESKGYAGEMIGDYAGLSRRHPTAALGMLIFMLALAGIPPTAGFMGKLYLFAAAVNGGYVVLTVIAVIMSAVSLYYYFRIVVQMYLRDGEEEDAAPAEMLRDRWTEIAIARVRGVHDDYRHLPRPVCGVGEDRRRSARFDLTRAGRRCRHRGGLRMAARRTQLRRARIWLDVSVIGIQFPVAIALGFFAGRWLDGQFGTAPWLMVIFSLCGIAAGFVNLFRITAQASRAEEQLNAQEAAEDAEDSVDADSS